MQTRPRPVDVHVGQRLRMRRNLLGVSQTKLGQGVGLTFQQIQKYERGANRIGASRLHEFSRILDVPVSYFFEELTGQETPQTAGIQRPETTEKSEQDPLIKRETLELVRAYYRISNPKARRHLFELTKALGKTVRGG